MDDTAWLIDRSALARLGDSSEASRWAKRIEHGLVRMSSVTRLEVGCWTTPEGDTPSKDPLLAALPIEYLAPASEERAIEVQRLLGERRHGLAQPHVSSVIVAAVAELAELTVLHRDDDFDIISAVTGQPMQRLEVTDDRPIQAVPSPRHQLAQ